MSKPLLVAIPYSPWSARAAIALKRMGIAVEKRTYTPTLSEPWLRWRLKAWSGPVTVPVLFPPEGPPLTDSLDIVRWGNARSPTKLIPAGQDGEVSAWDQRASRFMELGRARTSRAVLERPEALREALPAPVRALGPLGVAIGRDAVHRLLRKYPTGRSPEAEREERRAFLQGLREALALRPTLLEAPSYADLTVAVALTFLKPPERWPLGPQSRPAWIEEDLAAEFAPLLAWRDQVLAD